MKKEISLVIMAAGMGSRFGSLKQIESVSNENDLIMDFSIYDAMKAGFNKVVFIIKRDFEEEFKQIIGNRISEVVDVEYVFQELNNVPSGIEISADRKKPWGTTHAIYSCKDVINGPFAVINADDFYGAESFKNMYESIANKDNDSSDYTMIGFVLNNTLTDSGTVSRGVCITDEKGYLTDIVERAKIGRIGNQVYFYDGEDKLEIDKESVVSMNLWGFTPKLFLELEESINTFFENEYKADKEKSESLIPNVINELIVAGKATVKVLSTNEKWYGVTYKEDKEKFVLAIQKLKNEKIYPEFLWK